ncbi:MAG: MFS transporter, partial [Actinomycetota bacterium]
METAPHSAPGERRAVIGLLTAVLCSSAAALAGITALGVQVFAATGRELDLGILGLVEFLPAAGLVLVSGTVADRFERRRVAAWAFGFEALIAGGLALFARSGSRAVLPIYGLVLAYGICRTFAAPAIRSLPADLVSAERLPWLIARFSLTWQAAAVIGPVLGGFLYAADPMLPYVAMAFLLGVAVIAISAVPRPVGSDPTGREPALRPSLREAIAGLRFVRGHPVVFGAISLDLFAVLFGGALALLPAIAEERLGTGAVGLGWLRAAVGIGAGITTIALARRPVRRAIGRVLLGAVVVFGLGTIMLGVTRSYAVAFVAVLLAAGADAVSVYIRATLVPLATPSEVRGRVIAVENVFIGASNELGAFESGVAGQLFGAPVAVAIGGVATVCIAGIWWFGFPALRNLDEFPVATD